MRIIPLFAASVSISLRSQVAFRANLLFQVLTALVGAASGLAALGVVFTQTGSLAGWSFAETVVLLGTFQMMYGLLQSFVEPGLGWFGDQVKNGKLDEILVKPAPSVFLVSLGQADPVSLLQVATGLGILGFGLSESGSLPGVLEVCAWLALLVAGGVVMWASRVLVASAALWSTGSAQLEIGYGALLQLGRYPVTIYRGALRFVLTYLFPVGIISTFPAQVLAGTGSVDMLITALGVAVGAVVAVRLVWAAGLRRYTSATS